MDLSDLMPTLTLPQLEQLTLTARLSRELADYSTKQFLAQTDQEKAVYGAHVKTLTGLLAKLTADNAVS